MVVQLDLVWLLMLVGMFMGFLLAQELGQVSWSGEIGVLEVGWVIVGEHSNIRTPTEHFLRTTTWVVAAILAETPVVACRRRRKDECRE